MRFWIIGLFVIGVSICAKATDLEDTLMQAALDAKPKVPDIQPDDKVKDDPKCELRQTMAWEECGEQVDCDHTCTSETGCTFPYCNSLGVCECVPVYCTSDRMCDFYQIDCHGNFTCFDNNCYCN